MGGGKGCGELADGGGGRGGVVSWLMEGGRGGSRHGILWLFKKRCKVVPSDCRASPDVCGQVTTTPHMMDIMQYFKGHQGHFQ